MSNFNDPVHPVGTLVYGYGNPRKIGVVRRITTTKLQHATPPVVEVEWPDGSLQIHESYMLTPIDELIEDHVHKLEGHIQRRAAAAGRFGVNVPPLRKP